MKDQFSSLTKQHGLVIDLYYLFSVPLFVSLRSLKVCMRLNPKAITSARTSISYR